MAAAQQQTLPHILQTPAPTPATNKTQIIAPRVTRNPGYTALTMFGRQIRDIPHYGYLPYRIWPKRAKIRASSLADWCGRRFVESRKRGNKALFRINTYKHTDGKRYVDCVYFVELTDADLVNLTMLFGNFIDKKVERKGLLRRPRLKPEERAELDGLIKRFYQDCYQRRQERIAETGKAY